MKKIILLIIAILLIPFSGIKTVTNNYNPLTNHIYCHEFICIHEVGHLIDFNSGLVSSSKEFREYFKDEIFYGINGYPNRKWDNPIDIVSIPNAIFGWGGWVEFYSYNFEKYYGCENMMPESMHKFYDFETAYKELKQYGFDNDKICPVIQVITHNTPIYGSLVIGDPLGVPIAP
jgi:hypothetical protein